MLNKLQDFQWRIYTKQHLHDICVVGKLFLFIPQIVLV